eukprot:TRINITY_DN4728_c0_g1_i1.p1 TRINITY_DN4728_c0_g1~~TRINITY_DN4728_c0_g1_i1.p1  ORF type:complete len:110 (+),score=29.19 TRINITY_DN4728_c0_g1_i1:191-520(+)
MINTFGRLNIRLHELKADIQQIDEEKQNLEDAESEVMLLDEEDPVPYRFGEVYIEVSNEDALAHIESEQSNLDDRKAKYSEEIEKINETLSVLKVKLYGKFGSAINLDD